MNTKIGLRIVTGIVIMLLFVSPACTAKSALSQEKPEHLKQIDITDILDIKIPSRWGVIRDAYNSGTDKLIINIQDAHCDFHAQQNISNILERLAEDYRLKVITLEGAAGKVDNPLLSFFPKKKIKKEVSLYLVREGKLSGAEYLAANSSRDLKLFGVEDLRLYMDNLQAFQQSQPFKKEAKEYFAILKQALDKLKPYIYNEKLTEYDRLEEDYLSRRISFDRYAKVLFELLKKNGLNRINYPTFYELQKAIDLETKVDFRKADTERTQLITDLTQTITDKKDISELVRASLDFKKGIVSAGAFARFLKDMAFKMKLNLVSYPNFSAYAEYITKYEEVANERLFNELKQIKTDLKNAMYADEDQRQLDKLYYNLEILDKLVDLKMVNEDIEYFFKNRAAINSDSFKKFIEPRAYKYKLSINIPDKISYIDVYLPAWAKFYELADMRDLAFVEKTLKYMDQERVDYAALVTGGFHTEQLTKILKSKKISYLVITPKAFGDENNPYVNIMQGGKTKMEQFLAQLQSTLAPFITASDDTLESANLSENQVNELKGKEQSKLELQVGSIATFLAMDMISQSGSAGAIDWGAIKSEVKEVLKADFESAGISQNQIEHLNGVVENVVNALEDKVQVKDDGTVIFDNGQDIAFSYKANTSAENAFVTGTPADIAKSQDKKVFGRITLAPETSAASTSKEQPSITGFISEKFASLSTGITALNDVEKNILSLASSPSDDVISKVREKLAKAGLSETDIKTFIEGFLVADTNLAANPVVVQAATQLKLASAKSELEEPEAVAEVRNDVAQIIKEPRNKQEVLNKLSGQTGLDTETIDNIVGIAVLSTNPVVVQAAKEVAAELGIEGPAPALMSILQNGIAKIMTAAPEAKKDEAAKLTDTINRTVGRNAANSNTLPAIVDNQLIIAGIAADSVIEQAAKQAAVQLGIDAAPQVLWTLQTGIAEIMLADTPEAKKEAGVQLAKSLNLGAEKADSIVNSAQTQVSISIMAARPETKQVANKLADVLAKAQRVPASEMANIVPLLQNTLAVAAVTGNTEGLPKQLLKYGNATTLSNQITLYAKELEQDDVSPASLSEHPVILQTAKQVALKLGIDIDSAPQVLSALETGIAEILQAEPSAKQEKVESLNTELNNILGQKITDSGALKKTIDTQLPIASLAMNPAVVTASEQIIQEAEVPEGKKPEVMPVLQAGLAQVLLSAQKPEEKQKAMNSLVKDLGDRLNKNESELKPIVENNLTSAAVNVNAQAAPPVKMDNVKFQNVNSQLQAASLIESGLNPQTIASLRQNLGQDSGKDMTDEGFVLTSENMPEDVRQIITKSGMDSDVRLVVSPNRKGQTIDKDNMKVTVLRTEGGSATVNVSFDDFNSDNKGKIEEANIKLEEAQLKPANLLISDAIGLYSKVLSPTNEETVQTMERTGFGDKIKKMQGQFKFIAVDSSFFVQTDGQEGITKEGIKARLVRLISKGCVQEVTKNRTIKFMITQNDSLAVKNDAGKKVNINLYSMLQELGFSPDDFIVVDSHTAAAVRNAETPQNVTPEVIMEVAEKIAGKGNARVHYLAPSDMAVQLADFKASSEEADMITYSLFKKDVSLGDIKNGDEFIAEALSTMITGNEKMSREDRAALAGAILANIKIDMSRNEVESLIGKPLEATDADRTIKLGKDITLLYIAPETWA